MRWYTCSEHMPEEGVLFLAYSEVFQNYYFAKWSACRGWLDQENVNIRIITHWCDISLPLPFLIDNDINEEKAKEHNIKICGGHLFGS